MILLEHLTYLRDRRRMAAYEEAIKRTVRRGDVVLDLGCGTGVLGLLALKHGAAHVYAVDHGPVIHLARRIAADNGFADRMTFLHGDSTEVKLPRRADVLVTETLGHFGIDEGIVECVGDARKRLLKPHARTVPAAFEVRIEPVSAPALFARDYRLTRVCGLSFRRVREISRHLASPVRHGVGRALAPSGLVATLPLATLDRNAYPITGETRFTAARSGTLHGLSGFFDALLAPGVRLSSSRGTHWLRMFFPVDPPIRLRRGDRIFVAMTITDVATPHWSGEVRRGGKVVGIFAHSAFLGGVALVARQAMHGEVRPRLSKKESDRLRAMKLMDGRRTLDEIVEALAAGDGRAKRDEWKGRVEDLCLKREITLDGAHA